MKKLIPAGMMIIGIIVCFFGCGCTSAVSSFAASKPNLNLNESAVFEKSGHAFTVGIDHINARRQNSGGYNVTIALKVTNTGTASTTLMLTPWFTDSSGIEYATSSIFFSQIAPGDSITKEGTITIPGNDAFGALDKNAVITVKIQGASLFPYEAAWDVDNSTFAL
jgi:hypothetical protein